MLPPPLPSPTFLTYIPSIPANSFSMSSISSAPAICLLWRVAWFNNARIKCTLVLPKEKFCPKYKVYIFLKNYIIFAMSSTIVAVFVLSWNVWKVFKSCSKKSLSVSTAVNIAVKTLTLLGFLLYNTLKCPKIVQYPDRCYV